MDWSSTKILPREKYLLYGNWLERFLQSIIAEETIINQNRQQISTPETQLNWSQKIVLLVQEGKTCHGHTHTTQVLWDKQSMFNVLVFLHMHIWSTILVRTLF